MSSVEEKLQSASTSLFEAAKSGDEAAARSALEASFAADVLVGPDGICTSMPVSEWKSGPNQSTPLHYAAANGHLSVVKLLIDLGANVREINMGRSTALHLAGKFGHENVMKLLVELGADVNAEDLVCLTTVELHTHSTTFALTHETFYGRVHFNVQYGNTPVLNPNAGQLFYM